MSRIQVRVHVLVKALGYLIFRALLYKNMAMHCILFARESYSVTYCPSITALERFTKISGGIYRVFTVSTHKQDPHGAFFFPLQAKLSRWKSCLQNLKFQETSDFESSDFLFQWCVKSSISVWNTNVTDYHDVMRLTTSVMHQLKGVPKGSAHTCIHTHTYKQKKGINCLGKWNINLFHIVWHKFKY